MVPSLILNQLIKNDLDLFLLDRAVAAGGALIYIRKVIETPSDTSSLWLEGVERIEALAEILSTPSLIAAKAKPRLL